MRRRGSLFSELDAATDCLFVVVGDVILQLRWCAAIEEFREPPGEVIIAALGKDQRLAGIQVADLKFVFLRSVDPGIGYGVAVLFL
jgi:hypothetical protein